MPLSVRLCAIGLLVVGQLRAAVADTSALGIAFNNDGMGPDGPWNCLNISTDYPAQYVAMYPSMTETPMLVNKTICQSQSAKCPQPSPSMWAGSGASNLFADVMSASWAPSELEDLNGGYVTEAMGLQGSLRYISQRFTLSGDKFLDGTATAVADNVTVNYPNGSYYTVAVGYYSLYGDKTKFTYSLRNGTSYTLNNQLWLGYNKSAYSSASYGLHLGSSTHNVPGKFFLGGYDSARCIDTPIASTSNSTFRLSALTLGVASGSSAFLNQNSTANTTEITGLLQTNTTGATLPLTAIPDPGLPYLHLPAATCAALAAHLPVVYSAGLNLYLWNTSAPAYAAIVSSPHYLAFTFSSSSSSDSASNTTIALPLALLNLTLSPPLAARDTPYLPCAPWDPATASSAQTRPQAILGRAFLQGALLAHNAHAGTTWLAQAPGPGAAEESVKTIGADDAATLATGGDGSGWAETWGGVLKALDADGTMTGSGGGGGEGGASGSGKGLSGGAKAGVGVGIAVGVVAVVMLAGWLRRRRRARRAGGGGGAAEGQGLGLGQQGQQQQHAGGEGYGGGGYAPVPQPPPQEMDAAEAERREMDGSGVVKPAEVHGQERKELP